MDPIAFERAANVALSCWFEYTGTRLSTLSLAFRLLSRKYDENVPDGWLVPDLVTALTTTPIERPCVASNRLETNSNSAIESRL